MNRPETAILTFNTDWYFALGMQDAEQVGLYSSPFMDKKPWLSLGFGLILPLLLLGVAGYILVRPRKASSEF
ncbi:MAG: hypothetical protein P8M22_05025 [Phycisphaerales bacterium]|nr:hypothetical protein [Phycisphaerales bacterium]